MFAATEAADRQVVERVAAAAEQRGIARAQVALAWMLHKPGITAPIVGASKPHHLDEAVAALSIRLSDAEIRQLEELYQPHPVLGFS
jgi:1-deoxyxylulose-5-phosphate synthase